ncbi:MAG: hypothetical protein HY753_04160 [Nitrospirae bacterium]|nr:hypothetical protein [Nitrospirota bacterium]
MQYPIYCGHTFTVTLYIEFEKITKIADNIHMGKYLKNLLQGISQVLILYPDDNYVHPSKGDFRNDNKVLRKDANQIAKDLNKTIQKYGQQIYSR